MLNISPINKVSFKANLKIDSNLRTSEMFQTSDFAQNEDVIVDSFKKETSNFPNHELIIVKDSGGFAEILLEKNNSIVDIKTLPFFKYPQYQQLEGILKVFHHMRLDGEFKKEQSRIIEKYKKEMADIEEKYMLRLSLFNI